MKNQAGLWIDRRQAIVVFIGDGAEETKRSESGVEKHVRFSGANESEESSAVDQRDRRRLSRGIPYSSSRDPRHENLNEEKKRHICYVTPHRFPSTATA